MACPNLEASIFQTGPHRRTLSTVCNAALEPEFKHFCTGFYRFRSFWLVTECDSRKVLRRSFGLSAFGRFFFGFSSSELSVSEISAKATCCVGEERETFGTAR